MDPLTVACKIGLLDTPTFVHVKGKYAILVMRVNACVQLTNEPHAAGPSETDSCPAGQEGSHELVNGCARRLVLEINVVVSCEQ
jgi:hypothetical protein